MSLPVLLVTISQEYSLAAQTSPVCEDDDRCTIPEVVNELNVRINTRRTQVQLTCVLIEPTDLWRFTADLPRTEASAGSIRRALIQRHPDKTHV